MEIDGAALSETKHLDLHVQNIFRVVKKSYPHIQVYVVKLCVEKSECSLSLNAAQFAATEKTTTVVFRGKPQSEKEAPVS